MTANPGLRQTEGDHRIFQGNVPHGWSRANGQFFGAVRSFAVAGLMPSTQSPDGDIQHLSLPGLKA